MLHNKGMKAGTVAFVFLACVLLFGEAGAQTVSTVATFNNIGVEIDFVSAPTNGTTVQMYVKKSTDVAFRQAHPASRVSNTKFAGSIFELEANTAYSIRLESTAFPSNLFADVTTRNDAFPDATNRTLHVSVLSGNDTNSGLSPAQAFKTLGKALSVVTAGDKVLLYDGTHLEGDLDMPVSGTQARPIVIRNAPGAAPVLDGTDPNFAPSWSLYDAPNAVYRTPCSGLPENTYLNGGQFCLFRNLDDLRTNAWGQTSGYYVDGTNLYARFPGGGTPTTNTLTIPRYTSGITLDNKANIQIIGIKFCYYGFGAYHRGIYFYSAKSNLVDHCSFHHDGIGVAMKYAACFNTIQYCDFTESPVSTFSWHAVKDGDVGYEAGGVVVYTGNQPNIGNVARFNVFTNMFDGSEIGSDDLAGPTKDFDFHNNYISMCADDGIETDGVGMNNRLYRNVFRDFLTGVSIAPCAIGPTYIFRNVLSRWRPTPDLEFEGYPFKFNVSSPNTIDFVHIYHNTCYTDIPGQPGFLFKGYSKWTNIVSRNNIYMGTDYALDSWSTINPVSFDYDNVFTTHGSHHIQWAGTNYGTLGAFTAATGQEGHGLYLDPGFRSAAHENYLLDRTSKMIDRGVVIPGINDNYAGSAPDIGAFEFNSQATNLTFSGGQVGTSWQTLSNMVYQLQYTRDLLVPAWADIGSPATSPGISFVATDPSPVDAQRFYRLFRMVP
jgi:hypothetical protein